jgi:GNAT superfamily N-acetyltransferase
MPRASADPDAGEVTLLRATGGPALHEVRELFREYVTSIPGRPAVPEFDQELRTLPGKYGPPGGTLILARLRIGPVGCAGVRPLTEGRCELKRVYVRPIARGRGIGRRLVEATLEFAERAGYRTMMLDTLPEMTEALALYASLGFTQVPAYWDHPVAGARFFARPLRRPPSGRGTSK